MNEEYIYFKCIEVEQPIGVFYVGAMLYSQVLAISFADIRRIEERDLERYIGVQRPLDDKRVKELQSYVRTIDSSFPTSIILALKAADASYDSANGIMRVRKSQDVARIIDGQHRIAGLVNYKQKEIYQLNVTLFVDIDIEDQAHLFATINLKQTKVNRSLVYDLFDFATKRSPQKTCHNIAKLLDLQDGSPFYHRIKILGRASGRGQEYITQAAVVGQIIYHISSNDVQAMVDRDTIRRGQIPARATASEEAKGLFFRNMFLDERDDSIAFVFWNFFGAVAKKWPTAWNETREGFVLNRNLGFAALSRVLSKVYVAMGRVGEVPSIEEFGAYFAKVELRDADFNKLKFIPGTGGEAKLYHEFLIQMGLEARIEQA